MKKLKPQPACPECEKLASVSDESNQIGAFIEWLQSQQVVFCNWHNRLEMYQRHPFENLSINELLAQYYDIDLNKVEQERRVLLEWLREVQK